MTYPAITAHVDIAEVRHALAGMVSAFCDNASKFTAQALEEKKP